MSDCNEEFVSRINGCFEQSSGIFGKSFILEMDKQKCIKDTLKIYSE